jgi:hypothetical protein
LLSDTAASLFQPSFTLDVPAKVAAHLNPHTNLPSTMPPLLEIVIPLRKPTDVLLKTARSLAAQTERDGFAVLFSDNGTAPEDPVAAQAIALLREAGISTRLVRPPEELGRIEHWNWSHRQSTAEWIKPLFVGDWLEPEYAATVLHRIREKPAADLIHCSMRSHLPDGSSRDTIFTASVRTPAEILAEACASGNNIGGPVNICFRRLAFEAVGGYPPALPVSGDFWLMLMLALRHGLITCPEILANYNYPGARFSTNFPYTRINGDRELFIILLAATSYANFHEIPVSIPQRNRFFARLAKRTFKERLQAWWGRKQA